MEGVPVTGSKQAMSAGRAVVEMLRLNGIDRVFCVPGESFLPVLDALHDAPGVELVICRQEGGAAMMAEAYGKLTGRPGVCLVTRGPGSANSMSGLHVARQDSTPLILLVGQVPGSMLGREAWQEIEPRVWFGGVSKWAAQVHQAERLPEYLNRAVHTACAGRPGPVVLALPEDMLFEDVEVVLPEPAAIPQSHPSVTDMQRLQQLLDASKRPLAVLGGTGWSDAARQRFQAYAEANGLPVTCAFRRQDRYDNTAPGYAGEAGLGMNPRLAEAIHEADLLLAVGTRLGDIATRHYELVRIPRPEQRLVHVHADPDELGRVYKPDLPICAGIQAFTAALDVCHAPAPPRPEREVWQQTMNRCYRDWSTPTESPSEMQLAEVVAWLGRELPKNAVICNGAGNYTLWVQRFYPFRASNTQLAPTSGSMGYGLPAAIAAKLQDRERPAIAFAGDGCFLMTGQELATAVQYELDPVIVVVNNRTYGSIRMHQERHYPGRRTGTDLVNPDFVAYAEAFGVPGYRVECSTDFPEVFRKASGRGGPALIELIMPADVLKP